MDSKSWYQPDLRKDRNIGLTNLNIIGADKARLNRRVLECEYRLAYC